MLLAHPEWDRSCQDCRAHLYHADGTRHERRIGLRMVPTPRPAGTVPPCHECPKIPDDAPERHWKYAVEITARHRRMVEHYRRCRATNRWPDDPSGIVGRNAALIRRVEDALERRPMAAVMRALAGLVRG